MYQAQPPLEFIPPSLNPLFLRTTQFLLPSWIRWQTAISHIEADNVEVLVNLYHKFQEGKVRFLIAFRHPKTEDPLCLEYLLSHILPKVARRKGVALQSPLHAHFIYDRGIPLWAGSHIGWIASRLGGTPIQRGKADWTGLRSARDLFANGIFPMAAAPEGVTNGLVDIINPLEPGIAQFGFWCAEDLHKNSRNEQVFIVPVGIQYSYLSAPWGAIATLLTELETVCGLSAISTQHSALSHTSSPHPTFDFLYPRLLHLSEHLLTLIENFYTRFYHQTLPVLAEEPDINERLAARLQALLNVVLQVAEEYFDLQPKGNFNDRCRRIEQAAWTYIFREDFKDINTLSPLERALGDRAAEEANLRMWHMRLVESFVAVTGKYIREKPTPERFAETILLIWDIVTRIQGGNPSKMPSLGKQRVKITVGEPLSVSERYPEYKANRQSARQAVADLTKDLQQAMEDLMRRNAAPEP
ncbi:MAG: 1-acyl-sn-glycerol-3-phosphate acyltransferase [Scytonema sp. PMC 1069.18]|nr:1-acyl-sn-glycerol-3-phosphate acyltransferase [Scytonema sp. PMC 1069.18]MEC4882274.1 1-acyl-sn-glycerol-3-phosphate acyltransferase [Scytonema sp. PMC 1070.18]